MDEEPLKDSASNTISNNRISPRPLIDCLDIQSTFEKRKKNRTFERNSSSKFFLIFAEYVETFLFIWKFPST